MVWAPRPRPEWVEECNALGARLGDPSGIVALDGDSLQAAARALTGLDDFGTDDWREPFAVFLDSLDQQGRLHLVGRIIARTEILRALVNRLRIADLVASEPAILAAPVTAPILVTGTGRSGTSLLLELLAADPRQRAPLTWELLEPCPPPEADVAADDPRVAGAHREVTFWNLVTPEYRTMHENGGSLPNECIFMTQPTFVSDHWMGSYPVPSYGRWLQRADRRASFAYHRMFLQVLQARHPTAQWVLKAPSHLSQLPNFFAEYPDARVVITHRDPVRVLASITDLMATLQWQKTDHVPYERIVRDVTFGTAIVFDLVAQWRADGTIPDDRIVDVRYCDLVADPVATMRATYEQVGLPFDEIAERSVREYQAAHAQHQHGRHEYSFADTGLDLAEVRAAFAGYMARHDVPEEQ